MTCCILKDCTAGERKTERKHGRKEQRMAGRGSSIDVGGLLQGRFEEVFQRFAANHSRRGGDFRLHTMRHRVCDHLGIEK